MSHRKAKLLPEVSMVCPEPKCEGILRRTYIEAYKRWTYCCDVKGCNGGIGCHPDGRPLGIPADSRTRRMRSKAHEVFDKLWKQDGMTRATAYKFGRAVMGLDKDLHIAELDFAQCKKLIKLVREHRRKLGFTASRRST
jgi:hypothetical protein